MPIAVSIAMVTSVAGHVHFVLHPDADGACDHHGMDNWLEAALLDVLLVSLHPARHVGDVGNSAKKKAWEGEPECRD